MLKKLSILLVVLYGLNGCENRKNVADTSRKDAARADSEKQISLEDVLKRANLNKEYNIITKNLPCGEKISSVKYPFKMKTDRGKTILFSHKITCCWDVGISLDANPIWEHPIIILLSSNHVAWLERLERAEPPKIKSTLDVCKGYWIEGARLKIVASPFDGDYDWPFRYHTLPILALLQESAD